MKISCPKCKHEFTVASRRTSKQQRLLHALIGSYAAATGMDPVWVKAIFKYHYTTDWLEWPFSDPPEWPGKFWELEPPIVDEPTIVYIRSEASYDKDTERKLIDAIYGRCLDVGADVDF